MLCVCVCVYKICCCCSVTKLYPTLCDLIDCSTPGRLPCPSYLLELAQTHVCLIGDLSNNLILCHLLLLLPSIFPNIRGFSTESALHIRWPKYWSFSFSISPSNEYSGLISFRIDWFDLNITQMQIQHTFRIIEFSFMPLQRNILPNESAILPYNAEHYQFCIFIIIIRIEVHRMNWFESDFIRSTLCLYSCPSCYASNNLFF